MTDKCDGELMSCRQAAERGVQRLRKLNWTNPLDHVKIDIIDDQLGPWIHLWAPFNQECNGRDPVDILWAVGGLIDPAENAFVPYLGPLPDSAEYRSAVAAFAGVLGE